MKVVITGAAKSDLESIGNYRSKDNPNKAMSFLREILDCCNKLADTPLAYPLIPRYKKYQMRLRPFANYLIFYRVQQEHLEIVRILHSARDYERLLLK